MKKIGCAELLKILADSKKLSDLDLSELDLSSMDFSSCEIHNVDFRKSNLSNSNFSKARIEESNFQESNIANCDFHDARLRKVEMFNQSIDLSKFCGVDFSDCNLTSNSYFFSRQLRRDEYLKPNCFHYCRMISSKFVKVDMSSMKIWHCNLAYSVIESCQMAFSYAGSDLESTIFVNPDFSICLEKDYCVDMEGVNLKNVDLSEFIFNQVDWTNSDLRGAILGEIKTQQPGFTIVNKESIDFEGVNLSGISMKNKKFVHVFLKNADLSLTNLDALVFLRDEFAPVSEYCFENVSFREAKLNSCVFSDIKFRNVDFTGAVLIECEFKNCSFDGVNFKDSVLLQVSGFNDSQQFVGVDFGGAKISDCSFSMMNFQNSFCNFNGVHLERVCFKASNISWQSFGKCEIEGSDFSGALMMSTSLKESKINETSFEGVNLEGADFSDSQFSNCSLVNSVFRLVNFNATVVKSCQFLDVKFEYCNFDSTKIVDSNLTKGSFNLCNLVSVKFHSSNLDFTNLSSSLVTGSDFSNSNLNGSNLEGLELSKSSFENADLTNASFRGANLYGTSQGYLKHGFVPKSYTITPNSFKNAKMVGACLNFCDCENANFKGSITLNCDFKYTEFGGTYMKIQDDPGWNADPDPWRGH
jgi:uncharacterized protein YjbI with pentapeptide repeats